MTRVWTALFLILLLAAPGTAKAGDYDSQVAVVFEQGQLRREHVSPYPTSRRSASVWESDACWKTCTGRAAWRYEARQKPLGQEVSRAIASADSRACLRACRLEGGPILGFLR